MIEKPVLGMDTNFEHMSLDQTLRTLYWQGQYMLTHLIEIINRIESLNIKKLKELFLCSSLYMDMSLCSEGFINGISLNLYLVVILKILQFFFTSAILFGNAELTLFSFLGNLIGVMISIGFSIGLSTFGVWVISQCYRRWTSLVLKIVTIFWLLGTIGYCIQTIKNLFALLSLPAIFTLSIISGLFTIPWIGIQFFFHSFLFMGCLYLIACAQNATSLSDS